MLDWEFLAEAERCEELDIGYQKHRIAPREKQERDTGKF